MSKEPKRKPRIEVDYGQSAPNESEEWEWPLVFVDAIKDYMLALNWRWIEESDGSKYFEYRATGQTITRELAEKHYRAGTEPPPF